jgi:hypothetical protein
MDWDNDGIKTHSNAENAEVTRNVVATGRRHYRL